MQTQQVAAAQQSYSILGQPGPGKPPDDDQAAPATSAQADTVEAPQQDAPRNLDLSVGVRLEFFAAMKRAAFDKKNHNNLRDLIGHEMRRQNMQGKSGKVVLVHSPTEEELDSANGGEIEFPVESWIITRETSIDPDHPEWFDYYELQPIKIITPPYLGLGKWAEFENDIRTLLGTVNGEDQDEDEADLYCELNSSTHFHVEIGNTADDGGFDLATVKRLAILVLCFEKEIDKILADHMGYIYESLWAGSQRLNPAFRDLSTTASCHRIWRECTTIEEVANMMCPPLPRTPNPEFRHYYKYDFMSLLSDRPTIVFRQHEGTLNADEVIRWVNFVGGLVDLAHRIDIQNLARLVHLTDTDPVNFTELSAARAAFGTMSLNVEHLQFYTRKIDARGENLHKRSHMRYTEASPHICWKDVKDSRRDPDSRNL
ncbi:MAG: hypothetical protein M1830_008713 [Pleopsidium flavum]|nr:MAG: hypothetical protein M1830_008713 [Pleopsidium flavum]